jgi:radial spoke head protein 3
VQTEKYVE